MRTPWSKLICIDGSISACAFVFVYYMVPELQGRTLAEVDMMFDKGIPVGLVALVSEWLAYVFRFAK